MALSPYDQSVYDAGFKFVPQSQYLQNPFQIPEDEVTADPNTGAGITTLPLDRGDSNRLSYEQVTPRFDDRGFASAKEYGPGGKYEINPFALGFEFGPQGQVMRAGPGKNLQNQLGPSTTPGGRLFSSNLNAKLTFDGGEGLGGLSLRQIADMYDERMQQVPGQDFRNFLKRFTGAQSNFEAARAPGILQEMMGKIPSLTGILSSIGGGGDRSDTARFAVDNVGFGATGMRDQFGVFTGGKSAFGKTKNYSERMRNEIAEIAKSFGYEEDDLFNLDPNTLAALGKRNKFRQTQVIDYVNKLQGKELERRAKEQREAAEAAAAAKRERDFAAQGRSDPSDKSREGSFGRRPGSGGTVDRVTSGPGRNVDDTGQAYDSGGREGFGFGLAEGGRVPYMMGGLTDLVDIYD